MQPLDRLEDRRQPSTELAIVLVVEALEVDFVEIDVRPDVLEHARGAVSVGDETSDEPGPARLLKDLHRPFGSDERFVVGGDEQFRPLSQRVCNERRRADVSRWRDRLRIAQCLRCHPVLTIRAVEIAAEHAEAVGQRARVGVKERLLLDGIALHAADVTPWHEEPAATVKPHFAHAHRALGNRALVATGVAAQTATLERLDKLRRRFARALGEQLLQLHG